MDTGAPLSLQRSIISSANNSGFKPSTLILIGFPGLEIYHIWFAGPFFSIYVLTLLGNCSLLLVMKTALTLHRPMYVFISQLAINDLTMSSFVIPKALAIFLFNDSEIHFSSCLIQMSLSACSLVLESSILAAMAFDRYVAVCNPLRYSTILTNSLMAKIAAATLARCIILVAPMPLLMIRLPFCSRYVAHSYCEHMAVVKLSCTDISINSMYALVASYLIAPVDIACIALSYSLILRTILHLPLREDRCKAFSTCGSHMCVMSAFYIPWFSTNLLHRLNHHLPLYGQIIVSNTCYLLSPMMNPLIYGVISKEIRHGMHRIFQTSMLKIKF